jgi:hypothetical protein
VPRVDFRSAPAPVVARGGAAFTPRPVRVREASPASPNRLGRKISLNNLGAAYAAVEAEQTLHLEALEADEAVEELEDFEDADDTFGSGSYPGLARSGSFPGLARLGPPVELQSAPAPRAPQPEEEDRDDEADVEYELDADEVDLELDMWVTPWHTR